MAIVNTSSKGNLVGEWKQGNTKVRIFNDEYAMRSTEDIKKTMERVTNIAWEIVKEARYNGEDI